MRDAHKIRVLYPPFRINFIDVYEFIGQRFIAVLSAVEQVNPLCAHTPFCMGGTVELKLVYTSKVGTKTEVSKYLPADKTQIEVLTNNQFFKNDPEVAEWARSVIKIESDAYSEEPGPSNAHKGKRAYAYAGTSTSATGLRYRWETQPRKNGKFTKKTDIAENTGEGFAVDCAHCEAHGGVRRDSWRVFARA